MPRCRINYRAAKESFSRRNYFPCVIKTLTDDKTPDGRNTIEVDANDKAILSLFKLDSTLFVELWALIKPAANRQNDTSR